MLEPVCSKASTICFMQGTVAVDDVVGKEDAEGLVADDLLGHQHGVAEAERLGLARVGDLGELGDGVHDVEQRAACSWLRARASSSGLESKWSSMAALSRPVTMMISVQPAATASSTPYWISGLSTRQSISFGMALVAGRNRCPDRRRERQLCGSSVASLRESPSLNLWLQSSMRSRLPAALNCSSFSSCALERDLAHLATDRGAIHDHLLRHTDEQPESQ